MRVHSDDIHHLFRFKSVAKLLVLCELFLSGMLKQMRVIVNIVEFVELFIVFEYNAED